MCTYVCVYVRVCVFACMCVCAHMHVLCAHVRVLGLHESEIYNITSLAFLFVSLDF